MQKLRRFARASGGMAALEFAILAPFLMVPLLLGSVDLIDMLGANRRAQNTAASLADVVARDTEVSNAEIAGLWDAVDVLLYPSDSAAMNVRISSVRIVDANRAEVVWSESHGNVLPPLNQGQLFDLADNMMHPGTSVIVAETIYSYRSPLGFLNAGAVTMSHDAYRRSRLVDPIPRVS